MNQSTLSDFSNTIPPPPRKTNTKIIIIVAIVMVLCCICLVITGLLYYMGIKGEGPLGMLATDTSTPTHTPTRTPTLTPSPTIALSVVGEWDIYFSWGCTGDYLSGIITFKLDNTFIADDNPEWWGTWVLIGDLVSWTFDAEPQASYSGSMDSFGDYMEGTMDNTYDETGCWYTMR